MEYKVVHTTAYAYSAPVSVCHNVLMLTPRESGRARCHSHRIVIRPAPGATARRVDYFGNPVHTFSIEENHRRLSITATSRVTVGPGPNLDAISAVPWESVVDRVKNRDDSGWFEAAPFLFDSPRATRNPEFAEYASASFLPGRPVIEAVRDLTARMHADFAYDTASTHVATIAAEAFALRKGVCQDFAQIQVACLRSIGIPARYVSGYLRTLPPPGKPRLTGADQSHAWAAAYCGEAVGWVEIDATNDCVCGEDHIPIAWGRDYSDVVPIRGVFLGGGDHQLAVSVDVAPAEA